MINKNIEFDLKSEPPSHSFVYILWTPPTELVPCTQSRNLAFEALSINKIKNTQGTPYVGVCQQITTRIIIICQGQGQRSPGIPLIRQV